MFKRIPTIAASLILVLATLGASAGIAFAKQSEAVHTKQVNARQANKESDVTKQMNLLVGKPANLALGRMGVSTGKAGEAGDLEVTSIAPHSMQMPAGTTFESRGMNVVIDSAVEAKDKQAPAVLGSLLAYFDLTKKEVADFKSGNLGIYHFNTKTNRWDKLPAMLIGVKNGVDRLAARITTFGDYIMAGK